MNAAEELFALKRVLVEASVAPFDIGVCVVCGPIESRDFGQQFAFTEHTLEGVFSQLLQRVEDRAGGIVDDVNRMFAELADLRAYKERTEAGLQELRDFMCERWGKAADEPKWEFIDSLDAKGCDLGLWRDPPQAEVQP